MNYDELVAFVIKETGWTLEYIRNLPLKDLYLLADELSYQKQMDDYRQACNFAAVIAKLNNLWSKRKVIPQEIVGQPPKRQNIMRKETDIWQIAEKTGIRIPKDRG